jgi:hypothetical protein
MRRATGERLTALGFLIVAAMAAAALFSGAQASASPALMSPLRAAAHQSSGAPPAQAPIRRVVIPFHARLGGSTNLPVTSSNWAGYDATGGGFTSVQASWSQPLIEPDTSSDSIASFWVGLDGDGSNTVEQIGTQAENQYGYVTYSAWYEMYPDYEIPIPRMTIRPGDQMTATVTTSGSGYFTLTLIDQTSGSSYSTTQYSAVAQTYSAEVIAEAPTDGSTNNEYPLPNFGSVDFFNCAFNGQPISGFYNNQIDMVSSNGTTLAAASPLSADGASFSVTSQPGLVPAPTLTIVTPASSAVGSTVTLNGSGLSGASTVSFNGQAASFNVLSDTQITAVVPAGATSGAITVTTPGGTATSPASFTVVVKPAVTLKLGGLSNTTLRLGRWFTAAGTLRPASLSGSKVLLTVQQEKNGKWLAVTSVARTTIAGIYNWTYRPARRGTYRMKTTIAATATQSAATTMWATFIVK